MRKKTQKVKIKKTQKVKIKKASNKSTGIMKKASQIQISWMKTSRITIIKNDNKD
jgi:hypothetical protein